MNIDGRDVRLTRISMTGYGKDEKVGTRNTEKYTAPGGISVGLTKVTTKVCKPGEESCETTYYSVTLTVKKGTRTQTLKAIGECGS